jgi:hypothetical protein
MFLVDDIVFTASTSFADSPFLAFNSRSDILALSLRLHGGVTYCYANAEDVMQPEFLNDDTWFWTEGEGDWRYAMSIDGNVYRTDDVLPLLARLDFDNPNSLEAAMAHNPLPHPFMNMYMDAPRLINIPSNRVQDNFPNRHADSSLAAQVGTKCVRVPSTRLYSSCRCTQVNEEYLFGRRLDLHALHGVPYFCDALEVCVIQAAFSGVYGRSPHVDLPLVASVGAIDDSERGQSEEEGSEDGRLYKEL